MSWVITCAVYCGDGVCIGRKHLHHTWKRWSTPNLASTNCNNCWSDCSHHQSHKSQGINAWRRQIWLFTYDELKTYYGEFLCRDLKWFPAISRSMNFWFWHQAPLQARFVIFLYQQDDYWNCGTTPLRLWKNAQNRLETMPGVCPVAIIWTWPDHCDSP